MQQLVAAAMATRWHPLHGLWERLLGKGWSWVRVGHGLEGRLFCSGWHRSYIQFLFAQQWKCLCLVPFTQQSGHVTAVRAVCNTKDGRCGRYRLDGSWEVGASPAQLPGISQSPAALGRKFQPPLAIPMVQYCTIGQVH